MSLSSRNERTCILHFHRRRTLKLAVQVNFHVRAHATLRVQVCLIGEQAFLWVDRFMVRLIVVALVLTWSLAAHSGVYRWVDDEGNVVFSDTPPPQNSITRDIQQVNIPPVKTVPALQAPRISTNQRSNKTPRQPYKQFSITHPATDTAIRENTGNVKVQTLLNPSLQASDRVTLYMDGQVISEGRQTSFQLSNVDRGTHTLHAEVKDKTGKTLVSTEPVSFTLLRFSSLHRQNQPNSPNNSGTR